MSPGAIRGETVDVIPSSTNGTPCWKAQKKKKEIDATICLYSLLLCGRMLDSQVCHGLTNIQKGKQSLKARKPAGLTLQEGGRVEVIWRVRIFAAL